MIPDSRVFQVIYVMPGDQQGKDRSGYIDVQTKNHEVRLNLTWDKITPAERAEVLEGVVKLNAHQALRLIELLASAIGKMSAT